MSQFDSLAMIGPAEELGESRGATVTAGVKLFQPSDAELLRRFLKREEAAFRELVERHGSMVYGVAIRLVRDHHIAEDVFQATFLLLAQRAGRIRQMNSVSAWLHGVARHVARRALQRQQRVRHLGAHDEAATTSTPLDHISSVFNQQVLDEELSRLPASYRDPIVLHFLEGLTYEETAQSLGTTLGSIEGRLKRGKRELKMRLMRRGVELGVALAALHWSSQLAVAAQAGELVSITTTGGMALLLKTPFAPALSAEAIHLTRELTMWTTSKTMAILAATLIIGLGLGVIGANGQGARTTNPQVQTTVALSGGTTAPAADVQSPEIAAEPDFSYVQQALGGGDSSGRPVSSVDIVQHGEAVSVGPQTISVSYPDKNNPRIQKIYDALKEDSTLEFTGNPLSDVLTYISTLHELPIRMDEPALLAEGIGPDTEVKMVLTGVSLESAFNLLFADVGGVELDYVIKDEVVTVTTRTKADEMLEARVYDVRCLNLDDPETLVHLLKHTTSGYWKSHSGDTGGDLSYLNGTFVILQTQRVHREIEGLLTSLLQNMPQSIESLPKWSTPRELSGGGFY